MSFTASREDRSSEFVEAGGLKKYTDGGNILVHASCFAEEVGELGEAIQEYLDDANEETRAHLVKEWADTQVVLSNIAWFFDIPGEAAFNRVHASNMTKVVDGKVLRREDGKILKPSTYVVPDMKGL